MERILKDSIADKVTKQIVHFINTGRYLPGGKLPSNEEMAAAFGVSRSSVRESLKELQTLGIVTLRHGDGTYLCDFPQAKYSSALMEQVIEVRRLIEVYSARVAAANPDQRLIETLEGFCERMTGSDVETFLYYDREFHYLLSGSSNNLLIAKFHTSLDILFDEVQKSIVKLPHSRDTAVKDHKLILKALTNRDVELAAKMADWHIDHVAEQIRNIYESREDNNTFNENGTGA